MISNHYIEEALEDLAESIQVPNNRYISANTSYKSVREWLKRDDSKLRVGMPEVYLQGSFSLGTAIRPINEQEDYDVDLVCEVSFSRDSLTQQALKRLMGDEIKAYARAKNLKVPDTDGNKCWTLEYDDQAKFHIDNLIAIPAPGEDSSFWHDSIIAITDKRDPNYSTLSLAWPYSNPRGYRTWFMSCMGNSFNLARQKLASIRAVDIDSIPEWEIRTPLQYAVQILKRHRDVMFAERQDEKPISIIITTLAAQAYRLSYRNGDESITSALYSILRNMEDFIKVKNNETWIENPALSSENFANKWRFDSRLEDAFYEWLAQANLDFNNAAAALNRESTLMRLQNSFGHKVIGDALEKRNHGDPNSVGKMLSGHLKARNLIDPIYRRKPDWSEAIEGYVSIDYANINDGNGNIFKYTNNGSPIQKGTGLEFQTRTDVQGPYSVYWQVVNTGAEAADDHGLRGGFDKGELNGSRFSRREATKYAGKHAIECFLIKNGKIAARSGQFLVNIGE